MFVFFLLWEKALVLPPYPIIQTYEEYERFMTNVSLGSEHEANAEVPEIFNLPNEQKWVSIEVCEKMIVLLTWWVNIFAWGVYGLNLSIQRDGHLV